MQSLSRRLSLSLAGSLALFFLLLAWVFNIEIEALSEKTALSRMQHDMENLLAVARAREQGVALDRDLIDVIYTHPYSGHYYQSVLNGVSERSRSLWDVELPPVQEGIQREEPGPMGQQLLMLTRSYDLDGKPLRLTIAEDMSGMYQEAHRYQERLLLVFMVGLIVLLAVQLLAIRRGLRSLGGVRRALRSLESGESRELQLELPSEIAPLVREMNRLLLVMQARLERSRAATGNLAHALKTPLAVIGRLLEGAPGEAEHRQIGEQADKIERLIGRELSRARLAGDAPGGFWPQPEQDLRDLAMMLERVHGPNRRIGLVIDVGTRISADREDMMELLGNLLDNACKWATASVRCSLVQDGGLRIVVEDDGRGLSEPEWQALLQRGMRQDESRPGHGLGLAIVRDIVETYRGEMRSGRSELGGLRVEVVLPLSRREA